MFQSILDYLNQSSVGNILLVLNTDSFGPSFCMLMAVAVFIFLSPYGTKIFSIGLSLATVMCVMMTLLGVASYFFTNQEFIVNNNQKIQLSVSETKKNNNFVFKIVKANPKCENGDPILITKNTEGLDVLIDCDEKYVSVAKIKCSGSSYNDCKQRIFDNSKTISNVVMRYDEMDEKGVLTVSL